MTLSNFVINNLYPNNSAFINFPAGYDSNLSYSIISSNTSIATITNDNVINALSVGSTTITFSQGGDTISTTLNVDAVQVLIQANNQSISYGGTIPSLTYNINHQITDIKKSCNKQNIGIIIARQKVGYGINLNNGSKISDLSGINLSRFDAGNSTNPYINIWVTNSDYTNYAVISISPTWSKEYSNATYDTLKNEDIFIYETTGVQLAATGNYPTLTLGYQGTSWIANVSGVSGNTAQLKLLDLANLEIKAPPSSWFSGSNGTGSGAPRELSTYNAYGFNWIFGNINNNGDGTLADYIIGNATCNNSSSFTSYIIRNANNGDAPTISTDKVYSQSNISISTSPISTLANSSSNAGNYDITLYSSKFTSPYNLTFNSGTLTVTQAIINVTPDNKTRVYGSSNPSFTYTYTGFLNSDTSSIISGSPSISTSATIISNCGTYDIIPTITSLLSTNYTFSSVNGTLTVTQAIINVTPDNKTRVYGSSNPSFTYTYTGFLNTDTSSIISGSPSISTSATIISTLGTYDIIPTITSLLSTNYTFSAVNGTLTVTQATITVTPDNKSRVYQSSNPTFTYTYTGFLNGNTSTVITGTPSISTSATITSPLGTYDIIPAVSGLSATNYTFSAVNGTLTISKVIINVIADNKSKNYGDNNPTFTYTYNGFLNGDDSSVITGYPSISTSATQSSPVNGPNSDKTYYITVSNGTLSSANYDFNPVSGKLTINPITPTLSWKQSYVPPMIYGCQLTDNQIMALSTDKISGLSNGNFIYNVVSSNNVQTTVALGGTIPSTGTYTLYATLSVTNPNYLSSPVVTISKTLTVVVSNLTVKWYNPVPISHDSALTTTQLNAVCNDPNIVVTYVPPLGSTLSSGNQNLSVTFHTTDPGFTYDEIKNKVNINIT